MKIAFIGGRTFHHPDGIATFMYNLATELVKMGHEPIVYQESDCNKKEWINGFLVIHQKSYKSAALSKIILGLKATFNALIEQKRVDVFHYNGWAPSLLAARIPWLCGRISIMGGHGLEWKRTKYSPSQQRRMRLMERLTAYWNCNLTMCSQEQTDFFKKEYKLNCRTITGGVNLPKDFQDSNILVKFGIIPNNYIVYMGRLVQDKNPDYLIKGFMASNYGNKQLVICGNNTQQPNYVSYLKNIAKECKNIIFTDAVFGIDKDTIFRNAWVYCLPSSLEGLPISLLEGMSYGKVCLVSDIEANREALGDCGVWVQKENVDDIKTKLNLLYERFSEYEWQGNANKKRIISEFSWETKAHQYVDYINDIKKGVYCKK